jgi:hypothetical protein
MANKKAENPLVFKATIQAMMTKQEGKAYRDTLIRINAKRKSSGKKKIFESRMVRRLLIKFSEDPGLVMDFLNYEIE